MPVVGYKRRFGPAFQHDRFTPKAGISGREGNVDHVVVDHGALPADGLYFALKDGSNNLGEVDLDALVEGRPQALATSPSRPASRTITTAR